MALLRKAIGAILKQSPKVIVTRHGVSRQLHFLSLHNITPEELDDKFERYFNRCDIDGWDIRQGLNDLNGIDAVPEPRIVIAALYACRRVNDYAMTIRLLELVKNKCGAKVATIYPYVIQEIAPVLCELGVDTPEALGYHKPEMFLESVYHMR